MAHDRDDRTKTKEQWLREELRATRSLMNNTLQWGITVLAAAELNLYYLRREIRTAYIGRHPAEISGFPFFSLVCWHHVGRYSKLRFLYDYAPSSPEIPAPQGSTFANEGWLLGNI